MASIRIADSLTYGAKLFAFFLLVALVGGGGMVLGAALAVPELQTYLDGGSVGTTSLAGGAVLAVLGTVVWVSGTFAIAYKLIGDAVAEGLRAGQLSVPAAAEADADPGAAEESSEELGPSPGEQAAEEHGPGQTVPGAAESQESGEEPTQPAAEEPAQPPTEPAADQPAQPEPAADQPAQPEPAADQPAQPEPAADQPGPAKAEPAEHSEESAGSAQESQAAAGTAANQESVAPEESKPEAGRERTAEEIAFGTSGEREESAAAGPEQSGGGSVAVDDGMDGDDFEDVEEDVDPDETLADAEENVEPANKTGADPLADNFDDG